MMEPFYFLSPDHHPFTHHGQLVNLWSTKKPLDT